MASLLNLLVSVCPGDEGRPPAVPPPPVPHLGPLLACPPAPAITDTDAEGGTAGGRGRARGRGDAPGPTLAAGEGLDPGGDATGHGLGLGLGPTTGAEPEPEIGTGTGTGDDTPHTDEQGFTLRLLSGRCFIPPPPVQPADVFFFFFVADHAPAHDRGQGDGVEAVEATGEETATAAAPHSL